MHFFFKILAFSVMLINMVYRCLECWDIHKMMPQDTKLWKPPMFFLIIYSYINIGFHCTLWLSLWTKQRLIQQLCLLLIENITLKNRHSNFVDKIFDPILNNIAVIFWVLTLGIVGLVNLTEESYALFSNRLTFFDCLKVFFNINPLSASNHSVYDALRGILVISTYNIRQITGFFEEFFITIIVLAAWMKISLFLDLIRRPTTNDKSWDLIKRNYSLVKQMVDTANSVIQYNMLLHTAVVLFSYTFQFACQFGVQTCFTKNSRIQIIRFTVFLTNSTLVYYLAADIHHKVKIITI